MSIAAPEAHVVVTEFFDAMNERELNRLDAIVSANFVRHCEATPDVEVRSLDDFKAFLDAYTAVFPDNGQTPIHIAADGDLISIYATYEGGDPACATTIPNEPRRRQARPMRTARRDRQRRRPRHVRPRPAARKAARGVPRRAAQ